MPLSMFGEGRAEVQGRDEESKDEGSRGTEGSVSRVCLKRQRPESWGQFPRGGQAGPSTGTPPWEGRLENESARCIRGPERDVPPSWWKVRLERATAARSSRAWDEAECS